MQFAQVSGTDVAGNPSDTVLVPLDVPGLGRTYVDPEIAPRVRDFIDRTRQAGIDVEFESGFRTTGGQTILHDDPTATTPARPGNSLHEAGRAFDIKLHPRSANGKRIPNQELQRIVEQARQAGFNWGGNFRTPDPGHFHIEVPEGIENRGPRIQRAQEYYRQRLEDE
jgi:LAS superfamily LD-carboxypeptidase LdcB